MVEGNLLEMEVLAENFLPFFVADLPESAVLERVITE